LLPVLERVLGAEHPRTVTARSLHATAVLRAGDSARAVAAFAELLPVMERVLGAHHPDTQASWANFAGGQLEIADVSGAARSYSRVLGEELQRLGPGHPRTIARRFQLALAVAASGDIPSAMDALPDMATWPVTVNQYFEAVWRHRESVRFHREHGQPQAERAHLERLALLHDRFGATSDDVDADLARLEALTEQRRDTERNHG
jgi:hypothetical protein